MTFLVALCHHLSNHPASFSLRSRSDHLKQQVSNATTVPAIVIEVMKGLTCRILMVNSKVRHVYAHITVSTCLCCVRRFVAELSSFRHSKPRRGTDRVGLHTSRATECFKPYLVYAVEERASNLR